VFTRGGPRAIMQKIVSDELFGMAMRSNSGIMGGTPEPTLPRITCRYLLVINVPLYRDNSGATYAGQLWFKDLAEHLSYLDSFMLACPVQEGTPAEVALSLQSDSRFSRVRIIDLPAPRSVVRAILALPRTAWRLLRAVRSAEVIHAGVAGWPIPYGWIVTPMAKLLGKKLIIIVESAPWRLNAGLPQGLKSRITASVYERLARWCLNRADLAIFTQDEYRQSLLVHGAERGHVIHASWIDQNVIISDAHADAIWREKIGRNSSGLAILFAGRLEPQKGVAVLLEAIRVVARKNIPATLDILGSGDLADKCREVSAELRGLTHVNVLGTVAYGEPLFELLRRYHAVVLPSISDEQPRIVYDAYSQGVPALASGTAGLRDCIHESQTGWLVEPNNVDALSGVIERAAGNVEELRRMGMEALRVARSMTHQRMHRERQLLLLQLTRVA
jgi:glycosyltransferase involved in cell wall biosynthesis